MRCLFVVSILSVLSTLATAEVGNPISAIDLAKLRDIGGHHYGAISVSPDGKWIAYQLQSPVVSEGRYLLSWMTVSTTSGGKALRVADGGDVILNPFLRPKTNGNRPETRARWSPDSKQFAYIVLREDQTQIWLSRPNRIGQKQITHNAADVIDFAWSKDGSKLYFETSLKDEQVVARLAEEGSRGFLFDDRFWPRISQSPVQQICGVRRTNRLLLNTVGIRRACTPSLWVYDFKTKSERQATKEEAASYASAYASLRRGPIPTEVRERRTIQKLQRWKASGRLAWLENEDPKTFRGPNAPLTLHARIDGTIYRCADYQCRAYAINGHKNLWWSQNGEEVIFLRRDGASHSQTGLYAWTPSTGKLRTIFQSDDWLSDCSLVGERLLCLYETWTKPRRIASISLLDGTVTTLYDPNPEFAGFLFPKIEKLEWEDDFGNSTHGHLVYPLEHQPGRAYPLVIVTYQSRGFLRGGVGDEYPIYPLAAEGFFVLSHEMPLDLELRAKVNQYTARSYEDLNIRRSVLSSQERVVEALADQGLIDPKRVAITGLSEGSSQSTFALIHSETFAAAISSSGARKSPSAYYLMNEKGRQYWRWVLHGSPDDHDSGWQDLSLGLNVDRVVAPLLINVSEEELLGTLEDYARLQDASKPIEMYVFPDEHHIKWRPDHRLAIYRRNVQWLKFWLMGKTAHDPVTPDQYDRWTGLCKRHIENLRSSDNSELREKADQQLCANSFPRSQW